MLQDLASGLRASGLGAAAGTLSGLFKRDGSLNSIDPWISVHPTKQPGAILGKLPLQSGVTNRFKIPVSVVPSGATGILVFAWCGVTAARPGVCYWHVGVGVPGGDNDFFSLLVSCSSGVSATNSQAFWLPMPADRLVHATMSGSAVPDATSDGEVEIHGYFPG